MVKPGNVGNVTDTKVLPVTHEHAFKWFYKDPQGSVQGNNKCGRILQGQGLSRSKHSRIVEGSTGFSTRFNNKCGRILQGPMRSR